MADENAHLLESRIPLPDDLAQICRELIARLKSKSTRLAACPFHSPRQSCCCAPSKLIAIRTRKTARFWKPSLRARESECCCEGELIRVGSMMHLQLNRVAADVRRLILMRNAECGMRN